jgi:hypothetical protein
VVFAFQPLSVIASLMLVGVGGLILVLLAWLSKRTPAAIPMPISEGFGFYRGDQCQ